MNQSHSITNKPYNANYENIGFKFYKNVHKLMALIVIAWLNNGIFDFIMPYYPNFLRWGTFALWFILAIIYNNKFAKTFFSQCWTLLLLLILMLIASVFSKEAFLLSYYIKSLSYLIMIYSIFLYYFDDKCKSWQNKAIIFLSIDCLFVAINTYIKLKENPLLARYLSTAVDVQESNLGIMDYKAVGNYAFFYALVPIILLLTYYFFNTRKTKNRLLTLVIMIPLLIILVKSSFTLAILFTTIFIIIIATIKYINKYLYITIVPLLFASFILFKNQVALIFNNLATIDKIPYDVSIRLYEISSFFSNSGVTGSDLISRIERYKMSIDAFANNFIFGTTIPYHIGYNLGGHSTWLDVLALLGIFSILFFVFFIKAYKYCLNKVPNNFKTFYKIYWLYFVCLGLVNTLLFSSIFTIWFLFLPLLIKANIQTKTSNVSIEETV